QPTVWKIRWTPAGSWSTQGTWIAPFARVRVTTTTTEERQMTATHPSRATLDRQLDELEANLPTLIGETEPECVLEAFAVYANDILDSASAEDCRHVDARLDCILHK